jgi:sugar-specific transcriptional regulator TrmB
MVKHSYMQVDNLQHVLTSLGLSDKEAKVYLAALALGPSPVQIISRKSGVNRATTYTNIDALQKLGLMNSVKQGKKWFFYAESPEKLFYILVKQHQELLKSREERLVKVVPHLEALQVKSRNIPTVRYFEGKAGILELMKEVGDEYYFNQHKELRVIYPRDLIRRLFPEETLREFKEKRTSSSVIGRGIIVEEHSSAIIADTQLRAVVVPRSILDINCEIAVFNDTVRIITFKPPMTGIMINDENIANGFKQLFDLIWSLVYACYEADGIKVLDPTNLK